MIAEGPRGVEPKTQRAPERRQITVLFSTRRLNGIIRAPNVEEHAK